MKHLFLYVSIFHLVLTATSMELYSDTNTTLTPDESTSGTTTKLSPEESTPGTTTKVSPEESTPGTTTKVSPDNSTSGDTTTRLTSENSTNRASTDVAITITTTTTTTTQSSKESTTKAVCTPDYCSDKSKYCVIDENNKPSCKCKPGYIEKQESDVCESAKIFGSKLVTVPTESKRRASTKDSITELLEEAYNTTYGYITVNVWDAVDDVNWPYELFYEPYSNITAEGIKNALKNYFSKKCPGNKDPCKIYEVDIDRNSSINNTGNYGEAVCQNHSEYCDKGSTSCSAAEGSFKCKCIFGYVEELGNDQFCAAKLCDGDDKCNSPFGICDQSAKNNVGECSCIFGFNGERCEDPWLFVFVVVMAAFVLFALIGIIVCAMKKSNSKKSKHKKSKSKVDYSNYGYMLEENGKSNSNNVKASVPTNYGYMMDENNKMSRKNMRASIPTNIDYSVYQSN